MKKMMDLVASITPDALLVGHSCVTGLQCFLKNGGFI